MELAIPNGSKEFLLAYVGMGFRFFSTAARLLINCNGFTFTAQERIVCLSRQLRGDTIF